jgi:hypothetical protein
VLVLAVGCQNCLVAMLIENSSTLQVVATTFADTKYIHPTNCGLWGGLVRMLECVMLNVDGLAILYEHGSFLIQM